ncbi:hypothetical protein J5N97_023187 [Dioscorea zingiberensis]|uniref:Uncharacterized protein n=1 Tax=Dioscorea zingiberensis TaxID=325984 RepID=A0A9D5CCN6_9LILI|nr:hypothetical protein J5N97_023187 [Dioscorea zingiberensis]
MGVAKEEGRFSGGCQSFRRLVKEQRARFYILRRCIVMLICWNDDNTDA